MILNDIGVDLFKQSQHVASIPYFQAAHGYRLDDEEIVENLMMSYAQARRRAEGLDFIERNEGLFKGNLALLSYRPFFLSNLMVTKEKCVASERFIRTVCHRLGLTVSD